jgi:hypothetical protein
MHAQTTRHPIIASFPDRSRARAPSLPPATCNFALGVPLCKVRDNKLGAMMTHCARECESFVERIAALASRDSDACVSTAGDSMLVSLHTGERIAAIHAE